MKRSRLRIPSGVGFVETLVNDPGEIRRGLVFIAHPHPLHGGTLDNKVVQSLAQLCHDHGMVSVRPNFRGVGQSDGEYTGGDGETEDMLHVIEFVRGHFDSTLPVYLAGFSFGSYVQHRVAREIVPAHLLLVSPAVNLYEFGDLPGQTTIIHGELDEIVPFDAAWKFALSQRTEFRPVPGAGHFYHGKLAALREEAQAACHLS